MRRKDNLCLLGSVMVIFAVGFGAFILLHNDIVRKWCGSDAAIVEMQLELDRVKMNMELLLVELGRLNEKFGIEPKFKITAYSNDPESINNPRWRDGMTATGVKAREGIYAADWVVLPVGSRLWVDDYGWCEVQDRGGKVKGRHVDLFFNEKAAAIAWSKQIKNIIVERKRHDWSWDLRISMKAISLWQPWATAVALRSKR